MKASAWLSQLHLQWMAARGGRVDAPARAFRRDWEQLLDDAGITSAEGRLAAMREAEKEQQHGHVKLHGLRGRAYLVQKIELPLKAEPWLHSLFGTQSGGDWQQQSLEIVHESFEREHPLLPELWCALGTALRVAFSEGRVFGPFSWRVPDLLSYLLRLVFEVTARDWPHGTLIRDASVTLGHGSKTLEVMQAPLMRALAVLFGRETPLEALGIQTSNSTLHFSGPLTLHFDDGSTHVTDSLRFESSLPIAELDRATQITTTAERLLTVENRKTTFLQLARADAARTTLIVATSFPTQAVRRLLEKLSPDMPHHHFGDTDPAGWHILQKLRQVTARPVRPFQMTFRDKVKSALLTRTELLTVARLLADPQMHDCHDTIRSLKAAGRRGDFEQESLGPPSLKGWPFFGCDSG